MKQLTHLQKLEFYIARRVMLIGEDTVAVENEKNEFTNKELLSVEITQCSKCSNWFKGDETIINHLKWCK